MPSTTTSSPQTTTVQPPHRRSRRLAARGVLGAVIMALAIAPTGAVAAAPAEQYHAHVTDSFSDQICGIAVDIDLVATDNFSIYEDGSFKDTGSFRATVTNPVNGNSVVLSAAGQVRVAAPIVDEQAGTITFQPTFKGLPAKIQTANGAVVLRDAGLLTRTETIDLETGQLLASETIVSHGPHPGADSDYTRSCEVITQALA